MLEASISLGKSFILQMPEGEISLEITVPEGIVDYT